MSVLKTIVDVKQFLDHILPVLLQCVENSVYDGLPKHSHFQTTLNALIGNINLSRYIFGVFQNLLSVCIISYE